MPSLTNGFALDDEGDIVQNSTVHDIRNAQEIDQMARARQAVRDGLSRFPRDSRLLSQAQQLGVDPGGGR